MTPSFVLLTAAKNEARYIGATIEAVLRQEVRPSLWLIIDDGSSDDTAQIVQEAASRHPFIELTMRGGIEARSFGAKDRAINDAYGRLAARPFEIVAIQDADICPASSDCYRRLLDAFAADPRLGIAGGWVHERHRGRWHPRSGNSLDSVSGGLQMFRRTCYDQIGGYSPLHHGGEDWLAQLDAQIAGWRVLVLSDQPIHHHRPTSSADGRWRGLFRLGLMDGSFGSHPAFELLKCVRRTPHKPYLVGALLRYLGYLWWRIAKGAPVIGVARVNCLRRHQAARVALWLKTARSRP